MMPRHPTTQYNDSYWKKRQIFKMSAHFYGRARNCWSIAIRRVQRALQYVVVGRKLKKEWYGQLWNDRITAGCTELGNIPEVGQVNKF
jgi:large subunit ribosomal protein L20